MSRASKKLRQGILEIDVEQCALLVNYEIEVVEIDENGRSEVASRTADVKRIKFKSLGPDKNLAQMAEDVVESCKYIHPSRVEEVEQSLIKLRRAVQDQEAKAAQHQALAEKESRKQQKLQAAEIESRPREEPRSQNGGGGSTKGGVGGNNSSAVAPAEYQGDAADRAERQRAIAEEQLPPSNLNDLDDYLDMLYQVAGKSEKEKEEGLRLQVRGTGMILQLCRSIMNLEQLIQNGTVMGALTRVLQDEHKKSVDLTFNILRIFLAFSNFMEMHGLMANYRIGVLTMKASELDHVLLPSLLSQSNNQVMLIAGCGVQAIEFEIKRTEHRELERRERETGREDELAVARASADPQAIQQAVDSVRKNKAKEVFRSKRSQKKQDKLLFVAFYILINLAEDVSVERKMTKKSLIEHLVAMLDHTYSDLLVLVVTFLKKLSVFEEHKNCLKDLKIVASKLGRFLSCSLPELVNATLQLLFNLSFDPEIRDQIIQGGLIPRLVTLLKTPAFRGKVLKLLYHLSVDDRCKSMITYTDSIPILIGMIVNFPQPFIAKELAAVVVNLSLNNRNSELMLSNRGLNHLMERLVTTKDALLAKIIRNIAQWTFNQQQEMANPEMHYKYRGLWSPHIKIILQLTQDNLDKHDLLVEVFGILGNMTQQDLPANSNWARILREQNLLSTLSKMLVPGMAQNDMLLEIVLITSAIASDPQACEVIASSNIISMLYQLWQEKSRDDIEILLQLIHCFFKFLQVETSREEVMYSTRIVVDVIDCLSHKNTAVRQVADKFTEVVLELDRKPGGELGALGLQIKKKRFESYNQAWLMSMQLQVDEEPLDDEHLDTDHPMLNHRGHMMGGLDEDDIVAVSGMQAIAHYDDDDGEGKHGDEGLDWRAMLAQQESQRIRASQSNFQSGIKNAANSMGGPNMGSGGGGRGHKFTDDDEDEEEEEDDDEDDQRSHAGRDWR